MAEDLVAVPAAGAHVEGHVLDEAEDRHLQGAEHVDGLVDVDQRDVLRRAHDDGPGDGHELREAQRHVARARRQVHDQVVELAPVHVAEELLDRRVHDRTAHDHGLLGIEHEADGHDLEAVGLVRQRSFWLSGRIRARP